MDLAREKRKLVRRLPALTCTPKSGAECGETARCHWRQTADVRIKLGSHLAPGAEPPSLAAFGGTHGNEWEGQVAVKQLCQQLDPNQISGRDVILMPQLSQSACAANQRISPLDNVNMNRAFPGNSRGTISMRIADFVKTRIFPKTRIVIDLHAGGREGGFALCTSFHAVPDAAQFAEIRHAASLFDPPFILIYSSQMAHGLLTDEAEAEGKIGIGGEFGFGEGVSRKGVLHAYEGIRNVMKQYGMLAGAITKIDPMRQSPPPARRCSKS
jgi:N2-acetyl-L-2,4-diaminobutanoate deacetylase